MRASLLALLLLAFPATSSAQELSVSSFAGNGSMAFADGHHQLASFAYPTSLCRSGSGSIIVADPVNHLIRRIDASGVSTLAGVAGSRGSADGPALQATFNYPQGVACWGEVVFVADSGNATVRKIENGLVSTIAGTAGQYGTTVAIGSAAKFTHPVALAVDVDGSVFVADSTAHNIRRIRTDGLVETFAGVGGTPGHDDGRGAAARFNEPAGITIDTRGMIYVSDRGNSVIRQIDANGVVSTFAGVVGAVGAQDGARDAALFHSPSGIHADSDGSLLIVDSRSNTLRVIADGEVVTLAGVVGSDGYLDGSASAAKFHYPSGVTAGGDGTLYVADMMNQRVRSISSDAEKSGRRRGVRR